MCRTCGDTLPPAGSGGDKHRCGACYYAKRKNDDPEFWPRLKAWQAANGEAIRTRRRGNYSVNPEPHRGYTREKTAQVTRAYAACALRLPVADLTPDMYEAYRDQLLNKRALRSLNETLKEMK